MPLLFEGLPIREQDAHRRGLSRWSLRTLLERGEIRRVVRGVYVDAQVPDSLLLRASALALVLPKGVVVCRSTAAWLLGIEVQEINAHLRVVEVEVCSRDGSAAIRRPGVRGYSALLPDHHVTVIAGIEVTTPARTAIDLARWCERPDALAYVDALLHTGVVVLDELMAVIDESFGLPWIEQAREMVDLSDAGAESGMESRMRLRYLDAGFPRPECQIAILDDAGVERYRLDCGLRRRRYGFEYDGVLFHGPERAEHDARRRAWISAQGWTIDVFNREHVLGPTLAFEEAISFALGIVPTIQPQRFRRRTYAYRRRGRAS
ncbi:MAG TPA: type IV toxin-antitoxin system AbiEi family antitoxin [Actinomycetes bacterium]|nr:type IV toxin-antitoxin system AbiEi family antitoxin [Actinomycetes bacterium]